MSKRAVMATTIDCEGCKYDGESCKSDEGCIAFHWETKEDKSVDIPSTMESLTELLIKQLNT